MVSCPQSQWLCSDIKNLETADTAESGATWNVKTLGWKVCAWEAVQTCPSLGHMCTCYQQCGKYFLKAMDWERLHLCLNTFSTNSALRLWLWFQLTPYQTCLEYTRWVPYQTCLEFIYIRWVINYKESDKLVINEERVLRRQEETSEEEGGRD